MSNRLQHLQNLRNIFLRSVESVQPHNLLSATNNYNLVPHSLPGKDNKKYIQLQGKYVDLTGKRCYAVGFGKAVLGMAVQLEEALGSFLHQGIISIPKGSRQQFQNLKHMCLKDDTIFRVYEGAENNHPDDIALQAAKEIKELAKNLNENDILFVLISGGGSALLPLPKANLKLQEKMKLIKDLSNQGASIQEMNQVRIALSSIKGGQLAATASQASAVISFVISDIVGDPVDLIASGPTWVSRTQRQTTPREILEKYNLWNGISDHIKTLLEDNNNNQAFQLHNNSIYVVGDNRVATSMAVNEAMQYGYIPFIASTSIQGDVSSLVKIYDCFLKAISEFLDGLIGEYKLSQKFPFDSRVFQHFVKTLLMCQRTQKPLLLITAGEPTIKVCGNGVGGRNQEMALRMALKLYQDQRLKNVCFLSAGTDGIDGPTTAAGALACSDVIKDFLKTPSNDFHVLQRMLDNNDSYNFYKNLKQGDYHVITGHTGTNVMDIHLFLFIQ
ncbi:glycerate kinase [Haematobia irritans]|uniref:glycerate kinase n=1 Tax=Haematobia irritans TaxID=7368 RepID=UPI003F509CFE